LRLFRRTGVAGSSIPRSRLFARLDDPTNNQDQKAIVALSPYQQLEQEFRKLHAFRGALSLLRWDAAVMMPRGSADVRGEQMAVLETEYHTLLTAPKISRLLDRASANVGQLEDWQAANLTRMKHQRDHAIATPVGLISRLAKATARAEVQWLEAREKRVFAGFAPHLEEVVKLVRDKAQLLGQALNLTPYNALVDGFSHGIATTDIDDIFKGLGRRLPGLIKDALEEQAKRPALHPAGKFPIGKQRQLVTEVMKAIGFPFDRGRLDESEHPFTEGVPGDIRVTTRLDSNDVFTGLLGALHETGHAMYDQGLPPEWRDQPVGRDRGMALEESQSLLLEMVIGRSRSFLRYLKPLLDRHFGVTGPEWEIENLYRHLITLRRGLIRVDADELTYPLHIMLRYELEQQLLAGELAIKDLPEAWNAGMDAKLGVRPANDGEGCLQDIHWAVGSFGYFPSYALGAVIAAQLHEALLAEVPGIEDEIASGKFTGLFEWLRNNVHGLGAKLSVQDLIKQATGKPLSAASFLRYAEAKYLEPVA
jgi:carboxypeptidase Taq